MRSERSVEQLGRSIRQWRKIHNLTVNDLSVRAGISLPTLRAIEQGTGTVSLANVMTVLTVLGLDGNVVNSIDPARSDIGALRLEKGLPQRVTRPRSSSQASGSNGEW